MINYIIISDKESLAIKLASSISIQIKSARFLALFSKISQALLFINDNYNDIDIDIIIIYTSNQCIYKFFNAIKNLSDKKFYNSIILISSNNFIFNNPYILEHLNSFKNSDIISSFKNLVKIKNPVKLKQIIINYLLKLGYKYSHDGTVYLVEIILLLVENHVRKCGNLKKDIYPIIAKKYNTSVHNIKCDITIATKYMNDHSTLTEKEKFQLFKVDKNINTKSVINYILLKTAIIPN